jgi:hypothetical protein
MLTRRTVGAERRTVRGATLPLRKSRGGNFGFASVVYQESSSATSALGTSTQVAAVGTASSTWSFSPPTGTPPGVSSFVQGTFANGTLTAEENGDGGKEGRC